MGPYMLFATAEFSLKEINDILRRNAILDDEQNLWTMKSVSYKDLPRFEGNPRKSMPIPSTKLDSFYTDFIGKNLNELAGFLKQSPEDIQIDRDFFVVVDESTKKDGKMVLCMIDQGKVVNYRKKIDDARLDIGNFWRGGFFEEMMDSAKEQEEREEKEEKQKS